MIVNVFLCSDPMTLALGAQKLLTTPSGVLTIIELSLTADATLAAPQLSEPSPPRISARTQPPAMIRIPQRGRAGSLVGQIL